MDAKKLNLENEADLTPEEMLLDEIIKTVADAVDAEDNRASIVNHDKVKLVLRIYHLLKRLSGVKVTYKLNEPFKSMGSVSVVGKNIIFNNPEIFTAASRLASNVDIFPKTDGNIQVDFTFHGLIQLTKE